VAGATHLLAIAAAGAAGAVLRHLTNQGVAALLGRGFPFGTLAANTLGSFLIGLAFVFFWERAAGGELLRLAVVVGLLGGFTTFSAFSLDTWLLVQQGAHLKAAFNVFGTTALCLLATAGGIMAARTLI